MGVATRKYPITSNTFDKNVADIMNTEPFIIYTGSLDNSGKKQVEDTFMIPAGYALEKVTALQEGTTGNTTDRLGVGTTTATGVDGVAAVVLPKGAVKDCTIAASIVYATDRLGYIHTMDGTSGATYDIVCTYTIVLKKIVY